MLERIETRFGIKPAFLTADSAYGSADSLARLGHCPAHPGVRQVQPNRRHVLPRRLRLRRRTRPLHLPRGQRACPIPTHLRHSQKRRHDRGDKTLSRQQIGLRHLQTQSPVLSERSRPQNPAGSARRRPQRGSCARLNAAIRGGLSPSKENRDAIRAPQADTAPHASAIERSERSQRRVPPCGYRPKPETTRPTKADEYASGNAGRIAPRMAAQAPPKQPFQPVSETRRAFPIREYLTAFSTISVNSRRRLNVSNAETAALRRWRGDRGSGRP